MLRCPERTFLRNLITILLRGPPGPPGRQGPPILLELQGPARAPKLPHACDNARGFWPQDKSRPGNGFHTLPVQLHASACNCVLAITELQDSRKRAPGRPLQRRDRGGQKETRADRRTGKEREKENQMKLYCYEKAAAVFYLAGS